MEKLLEALTSPVWWVSVVVAGIAVNLTSAYLKPSVDGLFSSMSYRWRAKSEVAKKRRTDFLAALRSDPNEFHYQNMMELRLRAQATYGLLLGVFFLLFTVNLLPGGTELWRIPLLFISSFWFFFSFVVFRGSAVLSDQLEEARELIRASQQPPAQCIGSRADEPSESSET